MKKEIAKELNKFSKEIAKRFSYTNREGNSNKETFVGRRSYTYF